MKRIILAPDSFKGTLGAEEICRLEREVIARRFPSAEVQAVPMSDGGEGLTASYLKTLGGEEVHITVTGPQGRPVPAVYGLLPDGSAIVEMAMAAGLPLAEGRNDPMTATTYGVGELLLDAEHRGVRKVLLGLGGSATNDCGVGMAAALGWRFLDAAGQPLEPLAENLGKIEDIQPPAHLPELELSAACDVDNPLLGPEGATYTFGPQKGVTEAQLPVLEAGMAHYASVLERHCGFPVATVPGSGAAGGMGAAVLALLGGRLQPGVELLLDAVGFDSWLDGADLVFTGEGRADWQSARGKVLKGVGLRCKRAGVPCIALCGSVGPGAEALYDCGITAVFSAVNRPCSFDEIRKTCRGDLESLTDAVLRLYK